MPGALKTGARIAGGLAKSGARAFVNNPPGFAHFVPDEPPDYESLNADVLAAVDDAERTSGAERETGG